MANDAPTFNGFYCGALGGGVHQMVDPVSGDYISATNAALAAATEFDALLFAAGTVGANTKRVSLATAIARGMFTGRTLTNVGSSSVNGVAGPNPSTAATYAILAAAAVALYSEAVGNLA